MPVLIDDLINATVESYLPPAPETAGSSPDLAAAAAAKGGLCAANGFELIGGGPTGDLGAELTPEPAA